MHTFPLPSVTLQRCCSGSVGTVVAGGTVADVVGEAVVDGVAVDGLTLTTILEAFRLE